ncbi:uncharacterized protein [Notamacropus eugenii]|uniref:uncharacterized protein n=1 Tax=Notamacropus eugenii TaxID=9315 RepID=UPI003B682999
MWRRGNHCSALACPACWEAGRLAPSAGARLGAAGGGGAGGGEEAGLSVDHFRGQPLPPGPDSGLPGSRQRGKLRGEGDLLSEGGGERLSLVLLPAAPGAGEPQVFVGVSCASAFPGKGGSGDEDGLRERQGTPGSLGGDFPGCVPLLFPESVPAGRRGDGSSDQLKSYQLYEDNNKERWQILERLQENRHIHALLMDLLIGSAILESNYSSKIP